VSSAWKGKTNIMTMGWHMMLGFSPALFACYIWDGNHSFEMIRRSKECVINIPTTDATAKAAILRSVRHQCHVARGGVRLISGASRLAGARSG